MDIYATVTRKLHANLVPLHGTSMSTHNALSLSQVLDSYKHIDFILAPEGRFEYSDGVHGLLAKLGVWVLVLQQEIRNSPTMRGPKKSLSLIRGHVESCPWISLVPDETFLKLRSSGPDMPRASLMIFCVSLSDVIWCL